MSQTLEILVSAQGETTVQTKGFAGASCLEASRFLEEALGSRIADHRTTEFYGESCQAEQHQRQRAN